MKQKITEEMRQQIFVYSSSLIIALLAFLFLYKISVIVDAIKALLHILFPFIFGLGIAFVLHKPQAWLEHKMKLNSLKISDSKIRLLSTLAVFIAAILFIVFFMWISIPAIVDSLQNFVLNIGDYGQTLYNFIRKVSNSFSLDAAQIEAIVSELNITTRLTNYITETIPKIANYSYSFISSTLDFILALVSGLYVLLEHESLQKAVKKFNYFIFDEGIADYLVVWVDDAKIIFEKYIIGSIIDALVVGVVCYVGMLFLRMPYAPMIGLIIGITNIIPVFGPFLGAIPVIFLLMVIKPFYAVEFMIFILVLQQIDGNIIKPIVLGDQLGINGFWILFSVTVGGGLFGILGMFLGVPVIALLAATIKDVSAVRAQRKKNKLLE